MAEGVGEGVGEGVTVTVVVEVDGGAGVELREAVEVGEGDALGWADGRAVAEAHPPAAHPTATISAMARARIASPPLVVFFHPPPAGGLAHPGFVTC